MLFQKLLGANAAKVFPVIQSFSKNYVAGSNTVVSVSKPAGTQEGDILVAFMSAETGTSGRSWTQPSGWTEIADQQNTPYIAVAYKVATASEPSSYNFTFSTGDDLYCIVLRISGGAYDAIGSIASGIDPIVAPSLTVSANGSLLLAFFSRGGSGTVSLTVPTGMTSIDYKPVGAPGVLLAQQNVSAGSSGTRTSDADGSGRTAGVLVSIKPA